MDTVSIRAVWSKEANLESEKLLMAKTNFLDPSGNLIRGIGNEAVQSLYSLTKD